MTTKLYASGGAAVTVRDPDVEQKMQVLIGTRERTLSGAMLSDVVTAKYAWAVTWEHLSSAEWATLGAEIARTGAMTWQPVDEATDYTVTIQAGWLVERTQFGWTCTATLEES